MQTQYLQTYVGIVTDACACNVFTENGYRYLKFYIGGDLSQMTGVRLEEFRLRVSRLLCIPLEFVFIAGIEPSNSLLLTFMLPENSVEIFINITQHNDQFVQTFELLMEIGKNVLIFRGMSFVNNILCGQLNNKK